MKRALLWMLTAVSASALGCLGNGPPRSDITQRATCAAGPPGDCRDGVCTDAMLVVDISASTDDRWTQTPDRSIAVLEALAHGTQSLITRADNENTRVGLILFSGVPRPKEASWQNSIGTHDSAWVEAPLTGEHACVRARLDEVGRRTPFGMTHIAAAIDRATVELRGFRGAVSSSDPARGRVAVLLTDGAPTLPYGPSFQRDNLDAVERALSRARTSKIRVFVIAVGEEAKKLQAVADAVKSTGGEIHFAADPSQLEDAIDRVATSLPE